MTLTTINLTPRIGTEIKADRETLLSGQHSTDRTLLKPQFVYRHQWKVGDLLIWDNTGVMHSVLPCPFDSGRMLHRTTLVGEEALA
jgi:alpha-ketoglutarate-dependent taurine dioxygenase